MKKNFLYNVATYATPMLIVAKQARAAGEDGGAVIESITTAGADIPTFMMMGAYIMGIGFAITGLLKIKEAVENPGKESIKDGIFRLVIGGGLLALGTIMNYMVGTATEDANEFSALQGAPVLSLTP